jgi:hypothetical protein
MPNTRFRDLQRHLSRSGPQSTHSEQVVGRPYDIGVQLHPRETARERTTQAAIGLHPAKDFLDALSLSLTDRVSGMTRRARIEPWGLAAALSSCGRKWPGRTTCAFVDTHTVANLENSHRDRCCAAHARDLRPGRESPAHQCPIVKRPHRMAARSEMVRHLCMHRQEALGLPHRFESSHGAFSQARGLVRVLGPVVQ